jgi:hypothetical protein
MKRTCTRAGAPGRGVARIAAPTELDHGQHVMHAIGDYRVVIDDIHDFGVIDDVIAEGGIPSRDHRPQPAGHARTPR